MSNLSYSELKSMVVGDKPPEDVMEDYRLTFGTDAGKRVLSHMLVELNFFDEASSEEEVIRRNYAAHLLRHLGIFRAHAVSDVVSKLLTVDVYGGKRNEKV